MRHTTLIFFYYMKFEKVKWDFIDKIVLMKAGLGIALKFPDIGVEPNRPA